jgi:hypothetical protein
MKIENRKRCTFFTNDVLQSGPLLRRGNAFPVNLYYKINKRLVMVIQNKRFKVILLIIALFLLVPLIAMQFTDELKWTLSDFVAAGVLLLCTGIMCELIIRKVKKLKYRIAICAAILLVLLLTWAELAVGIFGSPFAGR